MSGMRTRVAVLISGRGSNMRALVEACTESHFPAEVVGVLSNVPDAPGLAYARGAGIETAVISHTAFPSRDTFDHALDVQLRAWRTEIVCLAGFMRILSEGFVRAWEGRMLNIHPSLLPRHPGLDTHRRALEAGDTVHGCSVHFVVPEVDAGPVILQRQVPVSQDDTTESLAEKVLAQEHLAYPAALRKVCESL